MSATKRKDPKSKTKASGANIPEEQRHTVAVKLRLRPEAAAFLDGLAHRWGLTMSATVERLLEDERNYPQWFIAKIKP